MSRVSMRGASCVTDYETQSDLLKTFCRNSSEVFMPGREAGMYFFSNQTLMLSVVIFWTDVIKTEKSRLGMDCSKIYLCIKRIQKIATSLKSSNTSKGFHHPHSPAPSFVIFFFFTARNSHFVLLLFALLNPCWGKWNTGRHNKHEASLSDYAGAPS